MSAPAAQTFSSRPKWPAFTGTILPGGYEIGDILEADEHGARFRARVLGDWSANAFVDVFCARSPQAEEQVRLWMAAKDLQHANLNSPLAGGEIEEGGTQLIYLVAPGADETLSEVLRQRPVTPEEAREILNNLRNALEYLHSNGWVHGYLSPEQVLAVGDSIRISTEYGAPINAVRPMQLTAPKYSAPEASAGNITPAADVWCLGATLFEALTQQEFSSDRLSALAGLPKPFDKIVAGCVDPNTQTRWKLEQVAEAAANRPVAPAVAPPEPVAAEAPSRKDYGLRLAEAALDDKRRRASKFWIYAVAAGVLVLLLLWAARPRNHQYVPVQAKTVSTRTSAPLTASAAPKTPREATTLAPPASPRPVASKPEKVKADLHTVNGPVWRVIVFSYSHEQDAENKAQFLNQKHPTLDAKVFAPGGQGSAYLVTVGGTMTREQAQQLRRRVIAMGLPHDTYIQNYKQ